MSSRHQKAGWYTPVNPDDCNCGECFNCRQSVAQAKVDASAAWVDITKRDLARAQTELADAQECHAKVVALLAEVKP